MEKQFYRIGPYSADFVVEPSNILYKVPSYHSKDDGNGAPVQESNNIGISIQQLDISTDKEDKKQLEERIHKEQQALIAELTALDKRVGAFIAKAKVASKTASDEEESKVFQTDQKLKKVEQVKDGVQIGLAAAQQKESEDNAQSKAASKKADKKAGKKEKKKHDSLAAAGSMIDSKVQKSGDPSDMKKETSPVSFATGGLQTLVKPPISESPILVYAKLSATIAVFPVHDYSSHRVKCVEVVRASSESIELHCSESDFTGWVKILAAVGAKRDVLFEFPGLHVQKGAKSVILKVVLSSATDKACETRMVHAAKGYYVQQMEEGVLPIWKFLGTLLGVYCAADVHVSTRTDQWLLWASQSLVNTDQLSRKMSLHLSRYDFLSGTNVVCLADLIVRSLFPAQWTDVEEANNVQLWVKRVDDSLYLN